MTLTEETDQAFGVLGQRFVIRELLGEGSFGAVYRCSSEGAAGTCEYAVKVINAMRIAMLLSKPVELVCPRLSCEIEILRRLGEHPRILKLHSAYFSPRTHRFYVVTELLKGGELFKAILRRRRPFSEAEGRIIFSQIVDAVMFCHSCGVAHRDLKLENCLLVDTESLNIKLCDYGQAKVLGGYGSSETAKTLTTTPAYTAPEVAHAVSAAKPYNAFKADAFGLGVLLYGMLCSALPDAARGANYERHRCWGALSEEAQDLIRGLLAPSPEQRLSALEAHNHPWLQGPAADAATAQPCRRMPTDDPLDNMVERARSASPVACHPSLDCTLAAQKLVVALQRERGTCCWAVGSAEGERSFCFQLQASDERLQQVSKLVERLLLEEEDNRECWSGLAGVLATTSKELFDLRRKCAALMKNRDETLDGQEDISEPFSGYSLMIAEVIKGITRSLPWAPGSESAPTRPEMRLRLLQYAAEQLGRERAFLTGHLTKPETLRLFGVVSQLAEIIGARKMMIGTFNRKSMAIVVADTGLLPALRLMPESPVDPGDLKTLEAAEERAMNARKLDPPAVTEWWIHLTNMIDKIHQRIMINIVECFSQSANSTSDLTD